jgi:hypothetical protein
MNNRNDPYLNERWYQIQSMLQKVVDDGLKYLTIFNGGGSVAVLSFIAQNSTNSNKCLWFSFSLFFIGLLLVGIIHIWRYLLLDKMLKEWGNDSQKFRCEKIEFEDLIENDNQRAKKGETIFYLGILCFILPILAFVIGILNIK